jgi:hypothetical protein
MKSNLHKAAMWYSHHGFHIFPCRPGTKVPATAKGFKEATTDPDQVDRWWSENPNYNIGIACGASGLVVIDFDTHKSGVHTDILFDDDDLVNSVMSKTPHGGTHVWFTQPPDMTLSNARGELPQHVDVRGEGGYILAPPSVIPGVGSYRFVDGHRPTDVSAPVLPPDILVLLRPVSSGVHREATGGTDQPHETSVAEVAEALGYIPTKMSYEDWLRVLMAVHSAFPNGQGIQLCEEWSPGYKGEISRKFASFKGNGSNISTVFFLAKENGWRQRAPVAAADCHASEGVRSQLFRLRGWVRSAACVAYLKKNGVRRASELIPLLDSLLVLGHERGTHRVAITHRTLAETCDIAPVTAWRRVEKLKETKLIDVEKGDNGTIISLMPMNTILSETDIKNGEGVSVRIEEMEWQASHRTDDAFTSYPYWSAVKRRGNLAPLMGSLGATGWLLWPHLVRGGTVDELAEVTGLSNATIAQSIRKFMSVSLISTPDDYEPGSGRLPKVSKDEYYQLKEGADSLLDNARPHMATFGVGLMRRGRTFGEGADYAAFKLRNRKKMEHKDVSFWEGVRDRNDREAAMYFDLLDKVGFDARMKVGKEKAVKRGRMKVDYREEYRQWVKGWLAEYNDLPGNHNEKVRRLAMSLIDSGSSKEEYTRARLLVEDRYSLAVGISKRLLPSRTFTMVDGEVIAGREFQALINYDDEKEEPIVGWNQLAFELEAIPHG